MFSELCEEWALANSRECVDNGSSKIGSGSGNSLRQDEHDEASEATFTLKYLGSTLVETPSSEEATAEAIKTVITMVRYWNSNRYILVCCSYIYRYRYVLVIGRSHYLFIFMLHALGLFTCRVSLYSFDFLCVLVLYLNYYATRMRNTRFNFQ